jgi:alanine-synthesizing transaminase
VGWVSFAGRKSGASEYFAALELLSSLRLCSNVPAQWAVQTALGGYQSIKELLAPGGRLFESRRAILEATSASRFLSLAPPKGSMYAFVRVKPDELPNFDDQTFALDLLEQKHVLLAPGTSFNVPYRDHFRTTLLPDAALLKKVFVRIDELLSMYASQGAGGTPRVVHAESRFKP